MKQTSGKRLSRKTLQKRIGLLIGLSMGILCSILYLGGVFDGMETGSADWLRNTFTRIEQAKHVVHVTVTQKDLEEMSRQMNFSWPWPREAWAKMLEYLKTAGAKVAVFDIIFSEHSKYGVEDDRKLASAISNFGPVVFAAQFASGPPRTRVRKLLDSGKINKDQIKQARSEQQKKAAKLARFALNVRSTDNSIRPSRRFFLNVMPYEEYLPVISGVGDVTLFQDRDSINRHKQLLINHHGRYFADLSIAAICKALPVKEILLENGTFNLVMSNGSRLGIPVDRRGRALLKFYGPYRRVFPARTGSKISAFNLIVAAVNGEAQGVNPAAIKDKIVIFGTEAPGLMDLRPNPFGRQDPGAYLYSTMIENILRKDFHSKADSPLLAILLLFAVTAAIGISCSKLSALHSLATSAGAGLLYTALAVFCYLAADLIIPLGMILVSLALTFLVTTLANYLRENRQKSFIQGAFSQMLAPAILEKLMEDPERLGLGGEEKQLTIFFSDLQGFTTFSEALGSPQRLVEILNEYLTAMADVIIMDYQGYVDKYEGDAIMAFWGAPVDDPDHAWKACYAAIDNQSKLLELQERFKSMGLPGGLKVRIGLNTGPAVVGMMGSTKKLNYTIIGDAVNLASRLEGVNKLYGTGNMISETTREAAGDRIEVRELDLIRVKGKTEPTRVFELLAKKGELTELQQQIIPAFQEALECYRRMEFQSALQKFEEISRLAPDDQPAKVYIDRCRQYIISPPAQPWDGVYTMTTK